ncbi:hypothetical protein V498_06764 [Pseudogymnoascus sp. VKM F-4517 (FW-2822)]|nr:hypothetical protein V498_06764 [Pseudogymnoascus sp. VKM F-4517 (FW-2822)]
MDTLFDSGKYSDLRITCHGRWWNVHRAVICTASPVFAAMVDGEFKNGVIDLPADEPDIVELMLRFLYQSKYDDTRPTAAITKALCTAESDGRGGIKFSPPVKLREEAMVVNVKVDKRRGWYELGIRVEREVITQGEAGLERKLEPILKYQDAQPWGMPPFFAFAVETKEEVGMNWELGWKEKLLRKEELD